MEQIAAGINDTDYYQIFYGEAISRDSSFPQICRIKPIFERLSLDDFTVLVDKIFESDDYEITTQFLYFLLLFRDMPHLQEYINSDTFSISYLEKLIIFTYGFCTIHDQSTDRIIDDILYFLSNDRLLDLALNSRYIMEDKLLLFFVLSKLDMRYLNKYFASVKDLVDFKKYFMMLPEEVLKRLISRNYQLFEYIMFMMKDGSSEGEINSEFNNRYKKEIDQFSVLHDIIREYKKETSYTSDKCLPFNKRDMGRISLLANMIKDLPDPKKAIDYFNGESVFIDEFEKNIVYAIVTDPVLKNIFHNYDRMLGARQPE